METFIDDEDRYLRWVSEHPNGFVINAPKSGSGAVNKLHKASCKHISTAYKNYTTTDYMKICSLNRHELVTWAGNRLNGFDECPVCKP